MKTKQDGYYCINDGLWGSPQEGYGYVEGGGGGISGDGCGIGSGSGDISNGFTGG